MLKEKGTPNSMISKKPPLDKLPPKKISTVPQHQKQNSQTNIKENANFQTQMQSLPNIAQKALEFKENLPENPLDKALDLKKNEVFYRKKP